MSERAPMSACPSPLGSVCKDSTCRHHFPNHQDEVRHVPVIKRVTEVRNEDGRLIYQMCCVCFEFIPVADLWVCQHGQKWDNCAPCAPHVRGGLTCTWCPEDEPEEEEK